MTTMLRSLVLSQLVNVGDADVIAEAKKRFDAYISEQKPISADLRALVYKAVVSTGDMKYYDEVLKIFRTAEMHEEKLRALRAVCYNESPEVITKNLQLGL